MRRFLVVGLLALLAVSACSSSTTDGAPSVAASTSSSASASARPSGAVPSAPASAGASSTGASSTGASSTGASSGSGAPAPTGCAPGAVTVTGAPFCYPLPTGFTDFSRQSGYAPGWTYRTLVSVTRHDLVEVLGAAGVDTDQLTDDELLTQQYPHYRFRAGTNDVAQAGSPSALRIDGARAFAQTGRYSGGVAFTATTVFFGRFVVFISCQSQQQAARVAAACRSVRAGIVLSR